jgi:hypothetical protein
MTLSLRNDASSNKMTRPEAVPTATNDAIADTSTLSIK